MADEPEALLEAINDRAITRLVVEDGRRARPSWTLPRSRRARPLDMPAWRTHRRPRAETATCASPETTSLRGTWRRSWIRRRGSSACDAGDDADRARADAIAVRAGEVPAELRAPIPAARAELIEDGRPVETYRRLDLDEALALL